MGEQDAILVIDDTALPKKGQLSVGVAPQYASALGKNANCQCLSVNKLNDLSDLCFGARREIGAADVDQREPRSLRPEQASLPK